MLGRKTFGRVEVWPLSRRPHFNLSQRTVEVASGCSSLRSHRRFVSSERGTGESNGHHHLCSLCTTAPRDAINGDPGHRSQRRSTAGGIGDRASTRCIGDENVASAENRQSGKESHQFRIALDSGKADCHCDRNRKQRVPADEPVRVVSGAGRPRCFAEPKIYACRAALALIDRHCPTNSGGSRGGSHLAARGGIWSDRHHNCDLRWRYTSCFRHDG